MFPEKQSAPLQLEDGQERRPDRDVSSPCLFLLQEAETLKLMLLFKLGKVKREGVEERKSSTSLS